jgi:hypothetical protein
MRSSERRSASACAGTSRVLDASIGREWIELDHADRPNFTQFRIAFGIH